MVGCLSTASIPQETMRSLNLILAVLSYRLKEMLLRIWAGTWRLCRIHKCKEAYLDSRGSTWKLGDMSIPRTSNNRTNDSCDLDSVVDSMSCAMQKTARPVKSNIRAETEIAS